MDVKEKMVLSSIYLNHISQSEIQKSILSEKEYDTIIERLVEKKLVESDTKTLTLLGRDSLRIVLAGGVFDIIHPGHIHTLKSAKKLGDILIVVVATDNTAIKMKRRQPLHSQEQRKELVDSLLMVDCCLIGQEEDIFKTVNHVRPQIIALGYDQIHQEKFITEGCKKIGLDAKVARLESPIPDSSSSKIQKEYGKSIHGI